MFEPAAWDEGDDCSPKLSALTWGVMKSKQINEAKSEKTVENKISKNKSKLKRKGSKDKNESNSTSKRTKLETPTKTESKKSNSTNMSKLAEKVVSKLGRSSAQAVDKLVNTPGATTALLATPGQEESGSSRGSLLTRGIKFSSADAFSRFMGLPGKGSRGKKASRELEHTEENNAGHDDGVGKENEAFKADTPRKSDYSIMLDSPPTKSNKLDISRLKAHMAAQPEPSVAKAAPLNAMAESAKQKLSASRFRYMNEQLYSQEGSASASLFKGDPSLFTSYHMGYQIQAKQWPIDPLNIVIADIIKLSNKVVIADFGCGEARLAKSVPNKVHSFDLVAANESVIACDMAKVPLESGTVEVAVFCLALMGTNIRDFIFEASRVLKVNGILKIAELESRFHGDECDVRRFISDVQKFGFKNTRQDLKKDFFYFFDFEKVKDIKKKKKLPEIELKPCLYKKR